MLTWSFGWTGFLEPRVAAQDLDGAVGDDLVGIHVGLRAAAGLPNHEGEMVVPLACDDFVGGLHDGRRQLLIELAQVCVDLRGRLLDDAQGADDLAWETVTADDEVFA